MKNILIYYDEFELIIKDIVANSTVQKMKNFNQHCNTDCFTHCKNVAFYSFVLCKKLHLDYISVARAAMLHDLFLYDWRIKPRENVPVKGLHAFAHPKIALINASKLFNLNSKEKDIILKHMWPITVALPKYKESYIVTLVDKFCAIQETLKYIKNKKKIKLIYNYTYIFLTILILSFKNSL